MFDAQLYREKSEVEAWRQRCPIDTFRQRVQAADLLDERTVAGIETAVAAEIEAAVAFAEAGTWEPLETLTRDVYTAGTVS
jgi:TPP-dependent pyruvate/acetoin dehydrogenase alpha subunit